MCAQCPRIVVAAFVVAPVFNVHQHDVHANVRQFGLHGTRHFEQHSHSAGSIVGAHHRRASLGRVGVFVSPRAAVPVRQQQDAGFGIGVDLCNDVSQWQVHAVEGGDFAGLLNHRSAITLERAHQIVATAAMCIGARHARSELALALHKGVSRVGVETYRCRRHGVGVLGNLFAFRCR